MDSRQRAAQQQAIVSGDAAALLLTPQAQKSFETFRAVRVSSENIRLEKFFARVYLNKVGDEVVSIRIDRYKHGMKVWERPSSASVERVRALIRAQRGW